MLLSLAVMTVENWNAYEVWWSSRGLPIPQLSKESVLVQDSSGRLVGAAMVYPTTGQYLLIESLACDPSLAPQEVHEVVSFMATCATAMGALLNKMPITLARGGIAQTLERAGFEDQELRVMTSRPGQLPSPPPQKEKVPAEGKELSGDQVGGLMKNEGATSTAHGTPTSKVRHKRAGVKRKKPKHQEG